MKRQLLAKLTEKQNQIIEIRRYLHAHPELSFQEENTAAYIADFYKNKDCDVRTNVGGHGVVVTIDSGKPGRTLAIRADFDALPIQEETGLSFASQNPGVMHACGHDGHTAYMLVLAETLIEMKNQLHGKIVILHQPAEETPPGGAIAMIHDGCLDGVDHVLGIHVMSTMSTGEIAYREGPIQTGRASFKVKIMGRGGHGSSPHMANDAIVASSEFVVALQTIISRRLNPFDVGSITIGSFDGRGSFNVIKDAVLLEGDVRAMTEATRTLIEKEIRRILDGLATMFGITYSLDYENDYPVLVNDVALTEFVTKSLQETAIAEVTEITRCEPQPPSEDFAYYAQERPSCFFYVGAMPANGVFFPHHHPKFDLNEDSLLIAAKAMGTLVADYTEKYKE
ncbi:M20 family metallopeptidase [Paenilisteria rocourtiae]|uniref:Amidohydrolase n=1 Tax=Listeria rocourtiae TaxID=647910 RepID=A0A4R6ZPL7_9LIST|nr:M20 family metallopeptidase [Listeria rocourtiae]EUJ47951.1 putative amidohydrolase yhaA [Listeria rocourtiae FSL F6-920]TDR54507.1 amidohydrolase [Listeria rocourtiae]